MEVEAVVEEEGYGRSSEEEAKVCLIERTRTVIRSSGRDAIVSLLKSSMPNDVILTSVLTEGEILGDEVLLRFARKMIKYLIKPGNYYRMSKDVRIYLKQFYKWIKRPTKSNEDLLLYMRRRFWKESRDYFVIGDKIDTEYISSVVRAVSLEATLMSKNKAIERMKKYSEDEFRSDGDIENYIQRCCMKNIARQKELLARAVYKGMFC